MAADFQKRERKQKALGHLRLLLEQAQSHFYHILFLKESHVAEETGKRGNV